MSEYAAGGYIDGEGLTIGIQRLGPCALCGAQLISLAPLGVAIDHLISAEDVKRKGRVDEIMECPGKVQG